MNTKLDIRSYNNPLPPSYGESWQRERLTGVIYTEARGTDALAALIRSVRPGSLVEVCEGFLLAPVKGRADKRRRILLERVDAIKDKGGIIHEVSTGHRSNNRSQCNRMLLRAYEMIATSGRARKSAENGRQSKGRPPHKAKYTPEQWGAMEKIWGARKYNTAEEALAAIHALGIKVKRGYMYTHFGKRD